MQAGIDEQVRCPLVSLVHSHIVQVVLEGSLQGCSIASALKKLSLVYLGSLVLCLLT